MPAGLAIDLFGNIDAGEFLLAGLVAHHVGVRRDVGEQRAAGSIGLDQVAHAAQNHVAGKHRRLGAVGESDRQHAPVLDVDRIGLEHGSLLRPQARQHVADVADHAGNADGLAARLRLDLLEIEHCRQGVTSHPDQRAAAGHRPLRRVRGMRAAVALLALHEQDLVPGGFQDLHGLGHRRRVDPVLGIHEEFAGAVDRRPRRFHFLDHALVHPRLGHVLADRRLVAVASEITAERLFADHVLAGLHRLDDHRGVQIGRRADVDDVDLAVGDQLAKAAIRRRDLVPAGKLDDVVAPRRDGLDFDIDAVDAPVGIHVQLRHEAAAGQTDPDFRHCECLPRQAGNKLFYFCLG